MSRDFLENRLFRAFSQENELANGTGLGMSLVAKLVRGFNGRIKVQSAKGSGTTMTVSMPIDIAPQNGNKPQHLLRVPQGLSIGFLDTALSNDETANRRRRLQMASISGACCRLGTNLAQPEAADINFAFEADIPALLTNPQYSRITAPTIVLCDNVMSAAHMRSSSSTRTRDRRLEFVAQPFGPRQLATALTRSIEPNISPNLSKTETQTKAALSREALRLQLSRRSHTIDLTIRAPAPHRPPLIRAGSAPPLSWAGLQPAWPLESRDSQHARSPITPTPLDLPVPDTPYLNGRTQSFKDAFEVTETNHRPVDKFIPPCVKSSSRKLSLLLVDDNVRLFSSCLWVPLLTQMQRINLRLLTTYAGMRMK